MKTPFFSIILATFNRAHLLPRAIDSVRNQDFDDWELIVVDDGSTDSTSEILKSYREKEPRMRILENPHQGLAKTRNSALPVARGEYLTFLDSDDEYLEGHLRRHHRLLTENPFIDMAHGKVVVVGDPFVPDARDLSKDIPIAECTQPGTFFLKTTVLKKLGGFPVREFGEDSGLLARAQTSGYRVVLSPHRTYRYYNTEPDSMCNLIKQQRKKEESKHAK